MARHDFRGKSPQKHGKRNVTYPYGDIRFPRVVENRTAQKGLASADLIQFLTPHPNQKSYPGAVLCEQTSDPGDDTDENITETYEVLPGPIYTDDAPYLDTGISMLVTRQRRAATDLFYTGELIPQTTTAPFLQITSVLAGNPSVVNADVSSLSPQDTLYSPRMWVLIQGTGTALDGNRQILKVLSPSSFSFNVNVPTGCGAVGGALVAPLNRIIREQKPLPNNSSVVMKVDTMVGIVDPSVYNEDFACWKDYQFPDFLEAINFYNDFAKSTDTGSPLNAHYSWGGAVGLPMQDGYHGPCRARRQRYFFIGPPPDGFEQSLTPTFIMPSSGTDVIEGGSQSRTVNLNNGDVTTSFSNSFRTGRIPHCLNGGVPPIVTFGDGQATVMVDMPPSVPTRFIQGQTITLMGQPMKHEAGALWEVIVWQIQVPYTSGLPVNGFTYTTNPAIYSVALGAITTNSPAFLDPSATTFAVTPTLPTGLSIDSSTGEITGTPTTATPRAIYTITASVSAVTWTAKLDLTVTV